MLFRVYLLYCFCGLKQTISAIKNDGLEIPANFTQILANHEVLQPLKVETSRSTTDLRDLQMDFILFTKSNKNGTYISTESSIDDLKNEITSSAFKVITHGWMSSSTSTTVENIKSAYMDTSLDINVITVNWEVIAGRTDYRVAATDTHNVGKELAKLIIFLEENKFLNVDDLHLIGHSLGAHVSGTAGYYVKQSGKVISRITGLDPAGPGFEFFNSFVTDANTMALNKDQATFVDIIHTSAGTLGFSDAIGHIDFYPNGGSHSMPGCGIQSLGDVLSLISVVCSHGRAHVYFAESIKYYSDQNLGFWSKKCDSYSEFLEGHCDENEETVMGESTDHSKLGIFYLVTNEESPYAMHHNRSDEDSSWLNYGVVNQLMPFS